MNQLSYAAVASLLFKSAVYIYLRVIPASFAKFILPALFILYLVCFANDEYATADHNSDRGFKQSNPASAPPNGVSAHSHPSPDTMSQISFPDSLYRILITHRTPTLPLRLSAFLINVVLLLFALDFTLRPLYASHPHLVFTRVGAVEPTSVKIVVRYPHMTDGVRILYGLAPLRSDQSPNNNGTEWLSGPIVELKEENDWVGVVKLKRLTPGQQYQYQLAFINSTILPHSPISFRTFPDNRVSSGSRFRFIVSSCVMPNFPYIPLGGNRIKGFDLLGSYISRAEEELVQTTTEPNITISPKSAPLEFGVMLGDFIYADIPVYVGNSAEAYTRLYRRSYASSSYRSVYEHLPILTIYDDHEILNNFSGAADDTMSVYYNNAMKPFSAYHGQANFDPIRKGEHYYEFTYGDAAFFVLDTRKHRRRASRPGAPDTLLGSEQIQALHKWLDRSNSSSTYKILISSTPFTTLWKGDAKSDSWAGYESERLSILEALTSSPNTFILSGDRHEFAAIRHLSDHFGELWELSTSPLSMFWLPLPRWFKLAKASKKVVVRESYQNGKHELEWVPEETVIKHHSKGHYKWSVLEVDTTDASNPRLTIELFVDGKLTWRKVFLGSPVSLKGSTAISVQLSNFLGGVFNRITEINNPISKYLSG